LSNRNWSQAHNFTRQVNLSQGRPPRSQWQSRPRNKWEWQQPTTCRSLEAYWQSLSPRNDTGAQSDNNKQQLITRQINYI